MNYSQRKNYRVRKKAKKYMNRSFICDIFVVLAGINIFGSYISIFISFPYFICSLIASLIIMAVSYNVSARFEAKANRLLKNINNSKEKKIEIFQVSLSDSNNIIKVDFKNKCIDDDYCSGM